MPDIRPAREDELDRVHLVVAYSFTGDRSREGRERMRHVEELANPLVLIETATPLHRYVRTTSECS